MPRKRLRTTERCSWTVEYFRLAVASIKEGSSWRAASIKYNIPYSTLTERMRNGNESKPRMGTCSTFNEAQEKSLVKQVLLLSNLFYGVTPEQLRKVAYEYAEVNGIKHRFNRESKKAGSDWFRGFLKRNPSVSVRRPEATSVNRISAFSRAAVTLFFDNLESVMSEFNFPPHRIFNMDETGISTVTDPVKIVCQKGKRRVGSVTSWERGKNVTAICAMSPSGIFIPPMFIFPRKRNSPFLSRDGPIGAAYECSENGWSNEVLFIKWLKHFIEHTGASQGCKVLLILDNHNSHTSLEAYETCRMNGITMLSIPPHTSHRTQPLDVSFFGPLKRAFKAKSDAFLKNNIKEPEKTPRRRHDGLKKITPYDLAKIFNQAFIATANLRTAASGFRSTGIFPLNRDIFIDNDFLPADLLTAQSSSTFAGCASSVPTNQNTVVIENMLVIPTPPETATNRKNKQYSEILTSSPRGALLAEKRKAKLEKEDKILKNKKPPKPRWDAINSPSTSTGNAMDVWNTVVNANSVIENKLVVPTPPETATKRKKKQYSEILTSSPPRTRGKAKFKKEKDALKNKKI